MENPTREADWLPNGKGGQDRCPGGLFGDDGRARTGRQLTVQFADPGAGSRRKSGLIEKRAGSRAVAPGRGEHEYPFAVVAIELVTHSFSLGSSSRSAMDKS